MTKMPFPSSVLELVSTRSFNEAQVAADFESGMRQRRERAKHQFLTTERLSAEPRGNEVDLRKMRGGRWKA